MFLLTCFVRFWHICHIDRYDHFTLKQLGLSLVNEMHRNFFAGPRPTAIEDAGYVTVLLLC